ncbi:MAG: FMN-dependent NADH-azoreductase [Verrucomicrobiaceae bacterium]|nr:FMN-dependent NADH-azoreductase [Verrucomicrobiaceae bacterium]
MAKVLVLNSSAKLKGSISRQLVDEFIELAKSNGHQHEFTIRDLAHDPVPVLHSGIVDAIRTKPDDLTPEQRTATALSEQLIGELKAADFIVIGAPIYNWSIPAALKAWIDQVTRIGQTFRYGGTGVEGMLGGKPALVILSRGGLYDSPERAAVDYQKPYLATVLNVIGLKPTFVTAEGSLMGEDAFTPRLAAARAAVAEAAASLK